MFCTATVALLIYSLHHRSTPPPPPPPALDIMKSWSGPQSFFLLRFLTTAAFLQYSPPLQPLITTQSQCSSLHLLLCFIFIRLSVSLYVCLPTHPPSLPSLSPSPSLPSPFCFFHPACGRKLDSYIIIAAVIGTPY